MFRKITAVVFFALLLALSTTNTFAAERNPGERCLVGTDTCLPDGDPCSYNGFIPTCPKLGIGSLCDNNSECNSGYCDAGVCATDPCSPLGNGSTCNSSFDCRSGYCDDKTCSSCSSDEDCLSGNCDDGECDDPPSIDEKCEGGNGCGAGTVCQLKGWWIFSNYKCVDEKEAQNACEDNEIWDTETNDCRSVEEILEDANCVIGCYPEFDRNAETTVCRKFDTTTNVRSCDAQLFKNGLGLANYGKDIAIQGGILIALDTAIEAINQGGPELSVLGIGGKLPAGLMEGLSDMMDWLLKTWLTVVLWGIVATITVMIGGVLIMIGLDINTHYLIDQNTAMISGHGIVLTIVNVGFVIALVVIGIMVILRRKEWDVAKTLPRFIAAVTLVNFGLFIAKMLVDVSSRLMEGFLGSECLWTNLFNSFSVANINLEFDKASILSIAGAFQGGGFSSAVFGLFMGQFSMVFATIFSVVGALTTLAVAVFLIVRYVIITVLLVFMPLAWLGFAVPKLKIGNFGNPWTYWWNQFMQWIVFGPLIAFFLYLGSSMTTTIGNLRPDGANYPIAGLLQVIATIIISAGGLFAASKMSAIGGGAITSLVGAAAGGAVGLMRKVGGTAFRGQLSAQEKLKDKNLTDKERSKLKFQAAAFKGVGGASTAKLGWTSKGLKTVGVKLAEQKQMTAETWTEEGVKRAEEGYKYMSDEEAAAQFDNLARTPNIGVEKRLALMKKLEKSGKLGLIKNIDQALAHKDRFGSIGTGFKSFELGLGTTAEIRAAEKEYYRTQEVGSKAVHTAQETADAAKTAHQDLTAKFIPSQNRLTTRETTLAAAAVKPGADNTSYQAAKSKFERDDKDLAFAQLDLSKAERNTVAAGQEVMKAQATKVAAGEKVVKAQENIKVAQAEEAKAGTIFRNTESMANDISLDPVIRNTAKAELEKVRIEKDEKVIALREAKRMEREAQAELSRSDTELKTAQTNEALAKTEESSRRTSHGQADTKMKQSKTEFETATVNNIAYQAAKKERDEAKTDLDTLTAEIKTASDARVAADADLVKTKTDADTAIAKSLGNISSKSSEWIKDIAKEDMKKIPLNNIMVAFDRDKSPMESKEAHEALQRAFVEETLAKGGGQKGGGLSSLLNVKSANFPTASEIVVREARKLVAPSIMASLPPKTNPGYKRAVSSLPEREKNIINSIDSINAQRINRGLPLI